ncbi:MAG: hypothetical protein KAI70_04405 [Candidatus Omnitrophica bacterium]|nr:hypothetical protein [Candidatus Omnitrophota bacterium]
MKKMIVLFIVTFMVVTLMLVPEGFCREKNNLYSVLSKQSEVRTYIKNFRDFSGDAVDMMKPLKSDLEKVLAGRISINFVLVEDELDSDIIISCEITERIWMEVDPIDMIHSLGAAAMDAAISENYARMQAVFTVEKGPRKIVFKRAHRTFRKAKVVWEQKVNATITKGVMSEKESIPLLEERLIKVFMRKCFSKNAKS